MASGWDLWDGTSARGDLQGWDLQGSDLWSRSERPTVWSRSSPPCLDTTLSSRYSTLAATPGKLQAGKAVSQLCLVCVDGRYGLTREEVPLLEYRGWAPALEPAPRGEAFVDVS